MSEINVDHIIEEWEERHNAKDNDRTKRFQISPSIKQDIKNTMAIGENGRIYFKK